MSYRHTMTADERRALLMQAVAENVPGSALVLARIDKAEAKRAVRAARRAWDTGAGFCATIADGGYEAVPRP